MTMGAAARLGAQRRAPFAPFHKWDRNFFLIYVVLLWFGILGGFVPEIVQHIARHKPPFPLIVHAHGVVFVGWLAVLTAQILLIRRRRPDLHRRLGVAAMGIAGLMVIIGPATAFYMQRYHWGTPESDPPFLAIQLTDIIAFAGLVSAAFMLRNEAAAHKRLVLLATLYISDAGFARLFGGTVHGLVGNGFWPFFAELYLANDILIAGVGVYDLFTRKRLYPAYMAAIPWIVFWQGAAVFLYHSSAWKPVALRLIGH
ncbi:MAG TPA: hypothetical protein VHU18_14915 [Rhizomicrobium sp.]|jgi:hypothetical protein|nr:hypothetical protein [Rhizomicrobium sp.]